MKKLLLFTCLLLALAYTISNLVEKDQAKYYEKSSRGSGYGYGENDCGIKKNGYRYGDVSKGGWRNGKELNRGYEYKNKLQPQQHYGYKPRTSRVNRYKKYGDGYDTNHCPKALLRNRYGRNTHPKRVYGSRKYYGNNFKKPCKTYDNDYRVSGRGYNNYRETSIGSAPPKP